MSPSPKSLSVIAILALCTAPALAQDAILSPGDHNFTLYKEVAGWTIYRDQDRGSCLIEGIDSNGTVVQMGLTSDRGVGYMGVFTKEDVGLKSGKQDAYVSLNGTLYAGQVESMKRNLSNGYQGAYFVTDSAQFVHDLEWGKSMLAFADKAGTNKGVLVDLTGTHKAITAARACNKSMM